MNNSDTLLKAAINRLTIRLTEKLTTKVEEIASYAQEFPEKFQKDWELLKKEIYEEAERLEKEEDINKSCSENTTVSRDESPRKKIEQIRAKVSLLTQKVEIKK